MKDYEPAPPPRLFSYLELLRLPNVFTAVADVTMGFLFVQLSWRNGEPELLKPIENLVLALFIAGSAMLYCAGVVLNDLFDVELDRRERPERPLPSGRVSLRAAKWLGWELLFWGTVLAWCAGIMVKGMWPVGIAPGGLIQFRSGIVAILLAGAIVAYNAGLKRTPLGPLVMGSCRMLNVLLGMSVLPGNWGTVHWLVAGAIGVYIVGVTWFARDESTRSQPTRLVMATLVMLAGIAMLASLRHFADEGGLVPLQEIDAARWYLAMGLFGVIIGLRCLWAVADPSPGRVRVAVTQAIISLVVLDAIACYAARGRDCSLLILSLLIPIFLSRWLQST